jgi:succinate dehydrogenase / fumarate reductase cytochrome b subunit
MSIMKDSREATMIGRRTDGSAIRRPLSPHLQVYDMLQMSSAMSISGRITGVIWSIGLLLLVWWLVAAATGPEAFAQVQWFLGSWIGILILVCVTFVGWFHTMNGIRHLAWDAGYGFDIPSMYRTGWAAIIASGVLTVVTWIVAVIAWA